MRILGWIPGIVALWLCAIAVWALQNVTGALEHSTDVAAAVRLNGDSDMMHDAIRGDVLERAYNGAQASPAKVRAILEGLEEHAKRFNDNMAELEKRALGGAVAEQITVVKPAIAAYLDAANQAMNLDGTERDHVRLSTFLAQFSALEDPMEGLGKSIEEIASATDVEAATLVKYAYVGLAIGFILAVVGGVVVTGMLSKRITRPLNDVVSLARAVSEGDLTYPLPTGGQGEIAEVVKAVGEMQARLTIVLGQIRGGSQALDATSTELVDGARQVADASQVQSEAAMTMAAGVEELTASINEVTQGASEALEVSKRASTLCETSEKLVMKVMQDMSALQTSVKESATVIHSLGDQSKNIRAIVQVIKDIADQTNLLALNAAIEAARAGEQGRGFAVVADEVRKLADRTGQSTKQIASLIDSIQTNVEAAVAGMERGVHLVDRGSTCAQQAAEGMGQVNEAVQKILQVVDHAAQAMREQSAAANESAEKVSQVAAAAEQNASVARNASAGAEQLQYLADSMKSVTSGFKVRMG